MTDAELEATKADVKLRALQRAQAFPDPSALQPTKSKKRPAPYLDSLPLSSLVPPGGGSALGCFGLPFGLVLGKRPRVPRRGLPAVERDLSKPFGDAVMKWLASEGRFAATCGSDFWRELQPGALVKAVRAAPADARDAAAAAVAQWGEGAGTSALFDALDLSTPMAIAQDSVFQALSAEVRVRFLAIERHAASIEGGRFRSELDAAVEAERLAAKTAAEAAQAEMRAAFEAREGDLQRQLAQAQRERDELAASHEKALADARVRLVQSVREVLGPDVPATGDA